LVQQRTDDKQSNSKVRSTAPSIESEFLFALSENHAAYFIISNAVVPNEMGQFSGLSLVGNPEFFPRMFTA
jgi:hypothetical protein